MRTPYCGFLSIAVTYFLLTPGFAAPPTPKEKDVLEAIRRATDFMMNSVSNHGGFLWYYSADLSRLWGEVPARKSQIWVQPPGTPSVGLMLVDAYQATGDPAYLRYADRVAQALIWGQRPEGGWHYLIDFDMPGLQKWYDEVASQCRGWEEFYYYYGNSTFDDDTTTAAVRFLLRLYMATLEVKYRPALMKALEFVLKAQYPNGAWPQRYPLRYDFRDEGHNDYTSYYTYNDGAISNSIYLLVEAWEKLGYEEYWEAARRGMDFYIISETPPPQAGWAQQYDLNLKPAWARSYEPAAICSDQTVTNIKDLENFYLITGDRRYLSPIPAALGWLERSKVDTDPRKKGTHATFYEVGTNKPLYAHHEARNGKLVRYWVDYEPVELADYAMWQKIDLQAIKKEFERVNAMTPEQAKAEYVATGLNSSRRGDGSPDVDQARAEYTGINSNAPAPGIDAEVQAIISSLDKRGAWITDVEFLDTDDYADNPPLRFKGIETAKYVENMYKLLNSIKEIKGSK